MTKEEIEAILEEYGVQFTDALAEKLLEVFKERAGELAKENEA